MFRLFGAILVLIGFVPLMYSLSPFRRVDFGWYLLLILIGVVILILYSPKKQAERRRIREAQEAERRRIIREAEETERRRIREAQEAERRQARELKVVQLNEKLRLLDSPHTQPPDPKAYVEQGDTYLELGRVQGDVKAYGKAARDAYLKALASGLSDPVEIGDINLKIADTFADESDRKHYYLEAERALTRHLKAKLDDLEALRRVETAYASLGMTDKAASVRARIRELEAGGSLAAASATREKEKPEAVGTQRDRTGLSFENKCLELLRSMGFQATLTNRTADGGIDIVATSNQPLLTGTYLVQCKDWQNPVGEPVLRDLYGLVVSQRALKGIVMTSSTFTPAAMEFAKDKQLELIDGDQLESILRQREQGKTQPSSP